MTGKCGTTFGEEGVEDTDNVRDSKGGQGPPDEEGRKVVLEGGLPPLKTRKRCE